MRGVLAVLGITAVALMSAGCGDDLETATPGGGAPVATPVNFDKEDRGCLDSDDAVGCTADSPSPPGSQFFDAAYWWKIEFVSATQVFSAGPDPSNPKRRSISATFKFTNTSDEERNVEIQDPDFYIDFYVSTSTIGELDGCREKPSQKQIPAGKTFTLTLTCQQSGPDSLIKDDAYVEVNGPSGGDGFYVVPETRE